MARKQIGPIVATVALVFSVAALVYSLLTERERAAILTPLKPGDTISIERLTAAVPHDCFSQDGTAIFLFLRTGCPACEQVVRGWSDARLLSPMPVVFVYYRYPSQTSSQDMEGQGNTALSRAIVDSSGQLFELFHVAGVPYVVAVHSWNRVKYAGPAWPEAQEQLAEIVLGVQRAHR